MKRFAAPLVAAGLAGCGAVSFGRALTADELALEAEVRAYYDEVKTAFLVGNAKALAALFDPSISRPMTHPQILAWGETFFAENKTSRFRIDGLVFDELGRQRAVVTLTYRVVTPGGKGDFGGVERDVLVRRRGRWYIAEWEKVSR